VATAGETVWSEGFGFADLEQRVPATTSTRFGTGSVAKPLTMALCARLVDAGLLDLDAPVERYLPDFPHAGEGITVRLIGGHLSGLDDSVGADLRHSARHFESTREVLELIYERPLAHPPGSTYAYGTTTYTVIAAVVEQVTGQEFYAAMKAHVLDPLGMSGTVLNDLRAIVPDRTGFFERLADGTIGNAPYLDPSYCWAGGGLLSTPDDLVRFGLALLGDGFLTAATRQELFTTLHTTDGTDTRDGLGWSPGQDAALRPCYYKTGGGAGVSSVLMLFPDQDFVVAIMSNLTWAPVAGDMLQGIVDAFLGPGYDPDDLR
jgi:CubicO group peptidase (beta-lactamase class C family)